MSSMMAVVVCGGLVLFLIGGLVGHSLSQALLQRDIRELAEVRRVIGSQWREMQERRGSGGAALEPAGR